jgi:peptidoglycan/xylan/chitin deacetylase (PgdA/CDA1 family)
MLDFLQQNKYETITFKDIILNKRLLKNSSRKVILTFDDCPKNLIDFAVPQLLQRNMRACFYMPTAYMGGYNMWDVEKGFGKIELMNEQDLKDLDRAGMEVGSHSHNHFSLREASKSLLRKEVEESKLILEKIIEKPVYSFAYPYGSVPKSYYNILSSTGYSYGLSIYQPLENKFALRRFSFDATDDDTTLKAKLSQKERWRRRFYDNMSYAKIKCRTWLRQF